MPAYVEALRRFVANSRRFGGSTPAVQEEFQFTALARLAAHAFRHSPFWGERLAACGWDPGKPFDRAALQRLPRLTRAEAQARYEDLKARPLDPALGKVVSVATSGSTGKPVTIDRVGVQALHYDTATILNHLWHRRDFLLKLAVVRTMTKTVHRQDWGHPMAALYRTGPSSGLSSADNTIESEYEWIEAEKPDYLITQPGRARAFARIAAERGGSAHRIKHLISVGETVSQELRRAVRESLGAEIKDLYSTRDAGYLALQCPDHDHYHVLADAVLIEVVDEAGRPVPAGEPGDVLVSILHSFAMPVFRYEIGDIAALGGPCDCGLTLPVVSRLLGRSRSLARMPDGRLRYVQFPGSRFLKIAPVREYQLIQRGEALMEAKIECGIPLTAEHQRQIAAMIQDCIGFPIAVKVTQVERLALSAEGKREEFLRID